MVLVVLGAGAEPPCHSADTAQVAAPRADKGFMTRGGDAVWEQWERVTHFLESTQIAYDREVQALSPLRGNSSLTVTSAGTYEMPLEQHLAAVRDKEILFASVLIHSYALAESAAADHLAIPLRELGPIEQWGDLLLSTTKTSWEQIEGGMGGLVEAAVARNAYAHGVPELDGQAVNRLRRAGSKGHAVGDAVSLHYGNLQQHRKRLRALLSAGGIRPSGPRARQAVPGLRRRQIPAHSLS